MDEREQLCKNLDELLETYGDMVYRVALQLSLIHILHAVQSILQLGKSSVSSIDL